ncbi:hypothetical protein ASE05_30880 [Mesorhizobium sp. Root172]|nr:hypothetical protein ASE05_30880 [Mesorhizobium sp. Root172]
MIWPGLGPRPHAALPLLGRAQRRRQLGDKPIDIAGNVAAGTLEKATSVFIGECAIAELEHSWNCQAHRAAVDVEKPLVDVAREMATKKMLDLATGGYCQNPKLPPPPDFSVDRLLRDKYTVYSIQ